MFEMNYKNPVVVDVCAIQLYREDARDYPMPYGKHAHISDVHGALFLNRCKNRIALPTYAWRVHDSVKTLKLRFKH